MDQNLAIGGINHDHRAHSVRQKSVDLVVQPIGRFG